MNQDSHLLFSCSALHQGIAFSTDRITPCCFTGKYTPPAIPFSGGKLPLEALIACFQQAEKLNQTSSGPCIGCPCFKPAKPIEGWGKFRTICINHFLRCNCRCTYCKLWNGTEQSHYYDIAPTIDGMIADRLFFEDAAFGWGGGEPTILPEFERVFTSLRKAGFLQVINTNAIRYCDLLTQSLGDGTTIVKISLDCGTRETFRRVKGLDAFNTVVDNIARMCHQRRGSGLVLKYIVKQDNCSPKDIDAFIGICVQNNIRNIVISPDLFETWENCISDEAVEATISLKRKAVNRGIAVECVEVLYGDSHMRRINENPLLHRVIDRTAQAFFRFPAHVRKILPHH